MLRFVLHLISLLMFVGTSKVVIFVACITGIELEDPVMMELMEGYFFLTQFLVTLFSSLLYVISYAGGVWWKNTHTNVQSYQLAFTLWRLCSSYGDFKDQCFSISGNELESVIITTRACTSIGLIFVSGLLVFMTLRFVMLKRSSSETHDYWLRARAFTLVLLMLFMLLAFSHSRHCPPVYSVGVVNMKSGFGWGWNMYIVSFLLFLFPATLHILQEISNQRSNSSKV